MYLFAYIAYFHYIVATLKGNAMKKEKTTKRKGVIDFRASFPDEESAIKYY